MLKRLFNIIFHLRSKPKLDNEPEPYGYILFIIFPGRRPIVKCYKLGENWYAHELNILSEWRVKLLPKGKVDKKGLIEGWEPISPNMIEFYHSQGDDYESNKKL